MYEKYLNLKHIYGTLDCIILVKLFYKQEFNIEITLPDYSKSKTWMREYDVDKLDSTILKYCSKLYLTDTKNYDLITFKSLNSSQIIHFGIFLSPLKMLHVEDGSISKIDNLNKYWLDHYYASYRHESLVL